MDFHSVHIARTGATGMVAPRARAWPQRNGIMQWLDRSSGMSGFGEFSMMFRSFASNLGRVRVGLGFRVDVHMAEVIVKCTLGVSPPTIRHPCSGYLCDRPLGSFWWRGWTASTWKRPVAVMQTRIASTGAVLAIGVVTGARSMERHRSSGSFSRVGGLSG
ncbi:hypothetical protein M758_1G221600 [Ceratodon purpureus]|uniref:Uncharacterized protein n=1 Tax=Ceratodon purpureus TaxID=3225 RepID=A0A8T0JA65_CERPU|nr:hypothetical protein KC19_1G197900 [Ceratodon purpureus]KAG0631020.1 hypothetical protein M758_1G221400 [Ceratodon purpureus]KAG0631023.1 hypothetical protein M758_1G221600 [Ceratodon purpureus]